MARKKVKTEGSRKEVLWRCKCKTQTTKKVRSLDDQPQIETEGKNCSCRIVSQVGDEDTKFGKEKSVETAIIRTDEPTGGFVQ